MATAHADTNLAERVGDAPLTLLLGTRWALGMKHLLVVAFFGLFFVYLTYLPLFHSDLWDHVAYGQVMLQQGQLLSEDPFLNLARGVPIITTMWLSQLIYAKTDALWGPTGLSILFSGTILVTYLVLARVFFVQTRRLSLAIAGAVLVFFVAGWIRHVVIRPEMFGCLCFALAIALVVRAQRLCEKATADRRATLQTDLKNWYVWLGIPVVFAAWSNLHGSFMCGLVLVGCFFVGHTIEVAWKKRTLHAVWTDPWVRRWLVLMELAVLGTLLNPFGIDLILHNLLFSANANLKDVTEWDPLVVGSVVGAGFMATFILFMACMRFSRRRIRAYEVLALAVFALAALLHVRMLSWYAPVAALVLMPHIGYLVNRRWQTKPLQYASPMEEHNIPIMQRKSWSFTVCCCGLVWISFAMSSFYYPMISQSPRDPGKIYSKQTPRELTAYLRENPPEGQVFNPQMWGGWIVWDGHTVDQPAPQVFMTTNIHVAPETVWTDYMRIMAAGLNWQSALDRYRVNTVIVDKNNMPALAQALNQSDEWQLDYNDDLAAVFLREQPTHVNIDGHETEDETNWLVPGLARSDAPVEGEAKDDDEIDTNQTSDDAPTQAVNE